jgi:hypothetical protein
VVFCFRGAFAPSPSLAYRFKIKRSPFRHRLIQASRRRVIVPHLAPTSVISSRFILLTLGPHSSIVLCPPFRLTLEDHSMLERIPSFDCCIMCKVASQPYHWPLPPPFNHIIGHCRPQPHPSWTFFYDRPIASCLYPGGRFGQLQLPHNHKPNHASRH